MQSTNSYAIHLLRTPTSHGNVKVSNHRSLADGDVSKQQGGFSFTCRIPPLVPALLSPPLLLLKVDVPDFLSILELVKPVQGETFVDLGSGVSITQDICRQLLSVSHTQTPTKGVIHSEGLRRPPPFLFANSYIEKQELHIYGFLLFYRPVLCYCIQAYGWVTCFFCYFFCSSHLL